MKKSKKNKNKKAYIKWLLIGSGVLIVIIGIVLLCSNGKLNILTKKVNIQMAPSEIIKLVDFENDEIMMKIPNGWKVNVGGTDMFYAIRVYDPENINNQIFAILKAQPFLKNFKAKSWYQNYYKMFGGTGNKLLAEAIVMDTPTAESFYSNFNLYSSFVKNNEATYSNFTFPDLKNFAVIESFESNTSLKSVSKDDKTLRGTFQNEKGQNGEGLFMASVVDVGKYMALGYDTMFYMVYNIMGITTNQYELINYQELLINSLNSLVYKESFVNNTIKNGQEQTKNTLAINKSIQEAYDSYNNAWTNRQKTYDITSQKYSDATLGYERVYDTKTGEIYKAYNGFIDDYDGKRYQAVTDDMYTESIAGYIEK